MKKFYSFEVLKSEGIKFVPGKARLNDMCRARMEPRQRGRMRILLSSDRIPCKLRVLDIKHSFALCCFILSSGRGAIRKASLCGLRFNAQPGMLPALKLRRQGLLLSCVLCLGGDGF